MASTLTLKMVMSRDFNCPKNGGGHTISRVMLIVRATRLGQSICVSQFFVRSLRVRSAGSAKDTEDVEHYSSSKVYTLEYVVVVMRK